MKPSMAAIFFVATAFTCGWVAGHQQSKPARTIQLADGKNNAAQTLTLDEPVPQTIPFVKTLVVGPHGGAYFIADNDELRAFLNDPGYAYWIAVPESELIQEFPDRRAKLLSFKEWQQRRKAQKP